MGQNTVRSWRAGGELQVPSSPWLMLGICSLNVLVLHETLLLPVLMYDSETVLWREERSRVKAVQIQPQRIARY